MDLSTTYIGLKLRTPLVSSACGALTNTISKIRALEDAGVAAIVVHSLFEEEILHEAHELDHYLTYGSYSYAEALNYFPEANEYELGPDEYLEHLHKAKEVVQIPVIGSLNGVSTGGWIKYAKLIEETGVDALELNIYYIPTDPDLPGVEVEQMYVNVLADVRRTIKIPVAIKMSPFFSNMASMAKRLSYAGANGLVLFNRFYQPDIDLELLEVVPNVILSTPAGAPIALALDCNPLREGQFQSCGHGGDSLCPGCPQDAHGRSGRDDDVLGATKEWTAADKRSRTGNGPVDGTTRI